MRTHLLCAVGILLNVPHSPHDVMSHTCCQLLLPLLPMYLWIELVCCNRKCTKTLSKAPCLVALRMSLTLHLLLFAQSMRVLIAMGFKYLILMEGKIYLIENQDDEMLGLFVFL